MPGGMISISAEGNSPGTGILWAALPFNTQGSLSNAAVGGGLNNVVPGVLHALDAEDISKDLWNSELNSSRDGSFMFAKFNPPVVANGRVYLATFGSTTGPQAMTGSINVYGMKQWAKFISQSYPSAPINAGTTFQAQVTFFNAGTTTWTTGSFVLSLWPGGLHPVGTPTTIPLPAAVAPGTQVTFTLSLPASNLAGAYTYQWQMQQVGVESFGESTPSASVQVGGILSQKQASGPRGKTQITITDSATNLPVPGATVTINATSGDTSVTTDSQGNVLVNRPRCLEGSTVGSNGKPIPPVYGPCPATAEKQPEYGAIYFEVPM
jgi:hypothetical protein